MNMRKWARIVAGWLGNGEGAVPAVRYYGSLLLVILFAFWPFRDLPGYYFTKTETSAALLSARLESAADLVRIITHPVLDRFHQEAIYYRPTYSLSFSLDYLLWGLDPFGYQLTDLILHVLVASLLFRVVYLINDRDVLAAGAAGILYSLHPVLIEVVPAVNHRQETLMATFLLAAFLAFLRYRRVKNLRWQAAALAFFLLSIGAKESGVVFVPLIMTYLLVFGTDTGEGNTRLRRFCLDTGPFVAAAGLYAIWWGSVTQARALVKGGKFSKPVLGSSLWGTVNRALFDSLPRVLSTYGYGLVMPFEDLYRWIPVRPRSLAMQVDGYFRATSPGALLLAALLLAGVAGSAFLFMHRGRDGAFDPFTVVLLVGLAAVVALPLYAPVVDWAVERAYEGEGIGLLRRAMDSRARFSAHDYTVKARRYLGWTMGGVLLGLTAVWGIRRISRWSPWLLEATRRLPGSLRPLLFYGLWFSLPLLFLAAVNIAHVKHGYHGAYPLAALLGTVLAGVLRGFGRACREARVAGAALASGLLVLLGLHLGVLLKESPLVKDYTTWRHAQTVFRIYYGTLFEEIEKLPTGSRIELRGVPKWGRIEQPYPHFNYLSTSLHPKPLVRVRFPERGYRITGWSLSSVSDPEPGPIWLERRQRGSHSFVFMTRYGLPSTP